MLRAWWRERAARERWALGLGGAALVLTVAYLAVEPVLRERQRLAAEIPQLRQDLAWMREHLATVQRLQGEAGPAAAGGAGPVTPAVVQQAVSRAGLRDQLQELRTTDSGGLRLSLKGVPFERVVAMLQQLRTGTGASVARARIQRVENQPGQVDADLTLAGGGGS
ncbi:MAG TPA: type II secretion system protein GspM [Gammaproteobacteria bacterium]|nr:type II secretion system protein GspM [Gammaproteobacteria bacterium]